MAKAESDLHPNESPNGIHKSPVSESGEVYIRAYTDLLNLQLIFDRFRPRISLSYEELRRLDRAKETARFMGTMFGQKQRTEAERTRIYSLYFAREDTNGQEEELNDFLLLINP